MVHLLAVCFIKISPLQCVCACCLFSVDVSARDVINEVCTQREQRAKEKERKGGREGGRERVHVILIFYHYSYN